MISRVAQKLAVVIISACIFLSPASAAVKARAAKPASSAASKAQMASAKPGQGAVNKLMALLPRLDLRQEFIYATGEGAMPNAKEQPNRAKAYLQAKAYAKMQAIASLAQELKGTMISYCSTGQGYMAEAQIKQEIKGVLDCVRVVGARKRAEGKDTIVEVTVRAPKPVLARTPPVADANAPTRPALPSWAAPAGTGQSESARPPRPEQAGAARDHGFTSVIIDAQGLGVRK
ncbi:MAG: hypothetical protein ACPL7K_02285, partial [Armatimonadota bacterium]